MDCKLRKNHANLWQCTRKGCRWTYPIPSDTPPRRNCTASQGFGDTVAKAVKKLTGLKPCGGCDKRRKWLNKILPYRT